MPQDQYWQSGYKPWENDPNAKKPTDWTMSGAGGTGAEDIDARLRGTQYDAYKAAYGQGPDNYYPESPGWVHRGGIVAPQWLEAMQQRRAALEDIGAYEARVRGGRSAAQQQLMGGIGQQMRDMRMQAGSNTALGRGAVYAGGELGQRGATEQAALKATELAYVEQMRQQALTAAEQQAMAQAQGMVTQHGIASGMTGLQAQLAAQQIQQQGQANKQALGAGLAAAGTAGAMLGGWFQGGGGGDQPPKDPMQTPYEDVSWDSEDPDVQGSDVRMKRGLRRDMTEEERLIAALQREGARTDSAIDAAAGRRADAIGRQLSAEGRQTDATLDALAGRGRVYEYKPEAQRWLGQPGGPQYGPMAQDLAKTKLGASAVVPTRGGLMVDPGRLSMMSAGLIGRQQEQIQKQDERLKDLERRLKESR